MTQVVLRVGESAVIGLPTGAGMLRGGKGFQALKCITLREEVLQLLRSATCIVYR
jgi:hypothetical protein